MLLGEYGARDWPLSGDLSSLLGDRDQSAARQRHELFDLLFDPQSDGICCPQCRVFLRPQRRFHGGGRDCLRFYGGKIHLFPPLQHWSPSAVRSASAGNGESTRGKFEVVSISDWTRIVVKLGIEDLIVNYLEPNVAVGANSTFLNLGMS